MLASSAFNIVYTGVIKTQWLDSWIHGNVLHQRTSTLKVPRELDQIHSYLEKVNCSTSMIPMK